MNFFQDISPPDLRLLADEKLINNIFTLILIYY